MWFTVSFWLVFVLLVTSRFSNTGNYAASRHVRESWSRGGWQLVNPKRRLQPNLRLNKARNGEIRYTAPTPDAPGATFARSFMAKETQLVPEEMLKRHLLVRRDIPTNEDLARKILASNSRVPQQKRRTGRRRPAPTTTTTTRAAKRTTAPTTTTTTVPTTTVPTTTSSTTEAKRTTTATATTTTATATTTTATATTTTATATVPTTTARTTMAASSKSAESLLVTRSSIPEVEGAESRLRRSEEEEAALGQGQGPDIGEGGVHLVATGGGDEEDNLGDEEKTSDDDEDKTDAQSSTDDHDVFDKTDEDTTGDGSQSSTDLPNVGRFTTTEPESPDFFLDEENGSTDFLDFEDDDTDDDDDRFLPFSFSSAAQLTDSSSR